MSGVRKCAAHGSDAEAKFRQAAIAKGWSVYRGGWPDFLIAGKGKPRFIEVKSAGDTLSDNQIELYEVLTEAGITVLIWWESLPNRLITWRRFLQLSRVGKRRSSRRFPTLRAEP